MTNRFGRSHLPLSSDRRTNIAGGFYATYSLGMYRVRRTACGNDSRENNRLHVILHCSAPRAWVYAIIGLQRASSIFHSTVLETKKSRTRILNRTTDGEVAVHGGMAETAAVQAVRSAPSRNYRRDRRMRSRAETKGPLIMRHGVGDTFFACWPRPRLCGHDIGPDHATTPS